MQHKFINAFILMLLLFKGISTRAKPISCNHDYEKGYQWEMNHLSQAWKIFSQESCRNIETFISTKIKEPLAGSYPNLYTKGMIQAYFDFLHKIQNQCSINCANLGDFVGRREGHIACGNIGNPAEFLLCAHMANSSCRTSFTAVIRQCNQQVIRDDYTRFDHVRKTACDDANIFAYYDIYLHAFEKFIKPCKEAIEQKNERLALALNLCYEDDLALCMARLSRQGVNEVCSLGPLSDRAQFA